MNLEAQLTALKNQSCELTLSERVVLSCRLAKQLEKAGEYEAACEALAEFWPQREELPNVRGLDQPTKADLLLRVGALAGWLGGANQIEGSQETAKNLITQSIELFEKLGESARVAEARGDLALCYWREGSFDEARITLANALDGLGDHDGDLKAVLLIRAGIIEERAQRLQKALSFYNEAAPLLEESDDHALKGAFHDEVAVVFMRLSDGSNTSDYLDRALIEYSAASFHFEQAGNERYLARVENNLGYLFFTIGRYEDSHSHLDQARHLFLKLKDVGTAAQVDDTRARALIAQGHVAEAERVVRSAVRVLERGGQQALLAEALCTRGVALARLGNHARARVSLERAIEVAERTGDLEGAGRAKLSIIEELGEKIPLSELALIYRSAIDLLKSTQDPTTLRRLIACASKLLDTVTLLEGGDKISKEHTWEGFSFKQHIHQSERAVIEKALRDSDGSVTNAARLLGFKHHQSLVSLINSRHKELMKTRSTVRRRRRHLFSQARKMKSKTEVVPRSPTSNILVLHVEDNKAVTRVIQDTLGAEGMRVDSCLSGTTALEILKSDAPYDAIIVDNNLPGLSGLELILRVRSMAHRRNTPIIMLSGDDFEKEAWRAGANSFLRKPEAVDQVASTITRLFEERKKRRD
jgi:two-component system chemotaxis response regulator CheY